MEAYREYRAGASLKYTIFPLKLTEHDKHSMQLNSTFIPSPKVLGQNQSFSFKLPIGHKVLFVSDSLTFW